MPFKIVFREFDPYQIDASDDHLNTLGKQLASFAGQHLLNSLLSSDFHSAVVLSFSSQRPTIHFSGGRDIVVKPLCFNQIGVALENFALLPKKVDDGSKSKVDCNFGSTNESVLAEKTLFFPMSGNHVDSFQYGASFWNCVGPRTPGFGIRTLIFRYALIAII